MLVMDGRGRECRASIAVKRSWRFISCQVFPMIRKYCAAASSPEFRFVRGNALLWESESETKIEYTSSRNFERRLAPYEVFQTSHRSRNMSTRANICWVYNKRVSVVIPAGKALQISCGWKRIQSSFAVRLFQPDYKESFKNFCATAVHWEGHATSQSDVISNPCEGHSYSE